MMKIEDFHALLAGINGCTFASLDSVTFPKKGIRCVSIGTNVILFTNKTGESGYGAMVKRRLEEAGKNPDNFVLGDLPWGERIEGTPLIYHAGQGRHYLQTVILHPGASRYYIGEREVDASILGAKPSPNQGLPKGREVIVNTFALDSITRITLLGETIEGIDTRPAGTLTLKF
jgi:hypothetical protein